MKAYAISLTVILILLLSGINFINTAKDEWVKTITKNAAQSTDICEIDPSFIICKD